MSRIILLTVISFFTINLKSQTISQFDFEDPAFDEKIATIGPNAISSGSLANARATGNGTPQGCAAGFTPLGTGGCFTVGGCPQNINMVVPNTGNIFNVPSPTMTIDYRRPTKEIDGWFWLKDQLAFGVRFSKLTARYSYDNGAGGCIPQIEFAAFPPAWNWTTNGLWTYGGTPVNGEIPVDGIWRTVGFTYDQNSGVASITISDPPHTEYNYGIAGRAFCGWTNANMAIGPNLDNMTNTTAFLDNAKFGNLITLPVILEYFNGEQIENVINLEWKLTTNEENLGFILYRSKDSENWKEIQRIGFESNQNYSYNDNQPYQGLNYYRLVKVNLDGSTNGFPSINVNFDYKDDNYMLISPNPVNSDYLNFSYKSEITKNLSVKVYNLKGSLLYSQVSNENDFTINIGDFMSGVYMIIIQNGLKSEFHKIIVE